MEPEQFRQARMLLLWSQEELAFKAGVHVESIRRLETGRRGVGLEVISRVCLTLAAAGIEIGNGGEVWLKGRDAAE